MQLDVRRLQRVRAGLRTLRLELGRDRRLLSTLAGVRLAGRLLLALHGGGRIVARLRPLPLGHVAGRAAR